MATTVLNKKERAALRWVRDQLRSGRLKHTPDYPCFGGSVRIKNRLKSAFRFFNMAVWDRAVDTDKCGTVCCIGGWMEARLGRALRPGVGALAGDLFCPTDYDGAWEDITPKRAARAIDNFLKDGNPRW